MSRNNGLLRDAALGAVAGLAATWVMGRVTSWLYEHEDPDAKRREDEAREGKTTYVVAAQKLAGTLGVDLSEDQRQQVGTGIHWALGAGAGAVYNVLRRRVPHADAGHGLAFGSAFWGVVDEGASTALGLAPGPTHFPWQAHARGLAGHLVFGVVADSLLQVGDSLLDAADRTMD